MIISSFIVSYLIIYIFRYKIQTKVTFVWLWIKSNSELPNKYEEINISTEYWNNINWIFLDNKKEKNIFFFHWNNWPINYHFEIINFLWKIWYNVFTYDYPWYWKSTWYPSEKEVYNYSDTFFNHIKNKKWIKSENIIIFWHSIWSAIWIDFAHKNKIDKIIVISPLTSSHDVCKHMFKIVIQRFFFMKDTFESIKKVKELKNPTLIIHWNKDKVIPFHQWKKIFENSISKNKFFIELDNFWHNWIIEKYRNEFELIFKKFIEEWKLDNKLYKLWK